jgi:hypothetical protein
MTPPRRAPPSTGSPVCRCVDQASGCAQNSPLWHAPAAVAISGKTCQTAHRALGQAGLGRCSVAVVAVNAEQAEDWNGSSGRHFIEQRERWERMRGGLTARLLADAQIQDGENVLDIGCGCGDTTILAARAAGSGHALGADLSRIRVAEARRLAAAAGVANAGSRWPTPRCTRSRPGSSTWC